MQFGWGGGGVDWHGSTLTWPGARVAPETSRFANGYVTRSVSAPLGDGYSTALSG